MATEPVKHPEHATHNPGPAAAKNDKLAADKAALAKEREERAKATAEREKNRGTPTPTQEEADLLKLGHSVELANDGSGPDPNEALNTVKHIGGKPAGEYHTRAMKS